MRFIFLLSMHQLIFVCFKKYLKGGIDNHNFIRNIKQEILMNALYVRAFNTKTNNVISTPL